MTPELLAGGAVAYLGMTYVSLKDPRYTLPALVYVAVLATGWVPSVRSVRLRIAAGAAVAIVAALNVIAVSTGLGST